MLTAITRGMGEVVHCLTQEIATLRQMK
jgi:hypothetical protein